MGHAMFYHLTRSALEDTVPMLLGRTLQKGWRVVVRGTDAGRMDWLDERLWLHPEDSFLPHGLAGGPHDADQPVLLTTATDLPAGVHYLMSIDGAEILPEEVRAMERGAILFDGNDPSAVEHARAQWRRLKAEGITAQYWAEDSGRWQQKA